LEKGKNIVIVGSGIGGLVCGAILAREGYKITVLEMNKQIGGNLQTYARDKHIFDSGVHYIGGLDKGQNLYKIFKFLGIFDKLKLEKLDTKAFDKICFYSDGAEFNYGQGYEVFANGLIEDFPDEKEAILQYCEMLQKVCDRFPLYNLRVGDYMEKSEFLEIDTKSYIESITKNKRLQNVLAGNNPLYAGEGNKTPIYVHALVLNSYIESSYRLINGGSQIAKHLCKIILDNGGIIKNRSQVTKLITENGIVTHAETATGIKYAGDYFISNLHPSQTLDLTDSEQLRPAFRNRIKSLANSVSIFILNITLKPGMWKYENCNYYCYIKEDVWDTIGHTDQNWPLSYALFYSGLPKEKQFAEGITVMAYMRMEEVEKWKDSYNTVGNPGDRGQEYEEFKKQKSEKLIDVVEQKFPGIKTAIKNHYASTPLTFRDYMGTEDGSIYGIAKDFKDPLKTFISPRTKISNLLLTGQNINLHGVLGVSISSIVTCSVLLGMENMIAKINAAQDE
jgi:all-trans-retinol 13,14-reductase